MEAIIQNINIYNDGVVEIKVMCNNCKHINYHTITHSSTKDENKTIIDFSKLGKRRCHNFEKNKNSNECCMDYNLYL